MIAGPPVALRVQSTAPASAVVLRVGSDETDHGVILDVDVIDAVLLPRGRTQAAQVWIDYGSRVDESALSEWSVSDEDGGILEWSVSAAAESRGVRGPLGYETPAGPALRGRSIDIGITVGATEYPVTQGAVVVDSSRGLEAGQRVIQLSGLGLLGRYDRLESTLQLAPEHGLTAGQVARAILIDAGVPTASIAIGALGPALSSPVDLAGDPAVETARDVLWAHGYALVERGGLITAVERAPLSGSPRATLTLADVLSGGSASVESTEDYPAQICVVGGRHQIPDDGAGEVTTEQVTEVRQVVGLLLAQYQQTSAGTLAATGTGTHTPERERPVSRTTRRETTRGGCLVRRETIVEALHRIVAARYRQAADSTPQSYEAPVWIYDPGAAQDDNATAYLDSVETFREVSREAESYVYSGITDELTNRAASRSGWSNPAAAVQSRTSTLDAWEDVAVGFVVGQLVLAGGEGVTFAAERYLAGPLTPSAGTTTSLQYLDTTETEVDSRGGYTVAEADSHYGRRIPSGWRHRYADGTESNVATALDGLTGTERRSWSDSAAGGARMQTVETDAEGRLVQVVDTDQPDGVPATPVCSRESRLRSSTVEVRACVDAAGGSGVLEISSPWIESSAQAEALARLEMRIARARRLSVEMPVMPALRVHDRVDVWMPEAGVEVAGSGWIESWGHELQAREGATTRTTSLVVRLP